MEILKLAEIEAILKDDTIPLMNNIKSQIETINNNRKVLLQTIEAVYDPNTDTWRKWCDENLADEEKQYLVELYNTTKSLIEGEAQQKEDVLTKVRDIGIKPIGNMEEVIG